MSLIEWDERYSVGIISIDNQHQMLVNMINDLDEALTDEKDNDILNKIFYGILLYTTEHFKYEEGLFKKYNFPESEDHCKEHGLLIEQAAHLQNKFKNNEATVTSETQKFLIDWLMTHIHRCSGFFYADFLVS